MSEQTAGGPWYTEVAELHELFQGWFSGALPRDGGALERVAAALAEEFSLISPDGRATNRASLLERLGAAYASRPDARLWVERPQLRLREGALTIVTYVELQEMGGARTRRISTAIFRDAPAAPNGLAWLHLHETWAP